jgi:hypothetical protein
VAFARLDITAVLHERGDPAICPADGMREDPPLFQQNVNIVDIWAAPTVELGTYCQDH